MVDEEEECGLLDMVVGIARPASSLKSPFVVTDLELNQLIRNSTSMDLADTINSASIRRSGYAHGRFSMLLARECDPGAVYSITTYDIEDFGVFLTWRAKSFSTRVHVVKEVLDLSHDQN